ncbi:hypothetical protein BGX31_002100 [Mortierella sp. GBA43]|nr:hypothetical protein BGX31_002100 [Mortierella sp. GBA43]
MYRLRPSDIYRRRHLIHDLTFPNCSLGYENFQYSNLRKLKISCYRCSRDVFLDLTNMFPSLVDLSLHCVNVTAETWLTLLDHPHCKKLELDFCELKSGTISEFWRACTNLETLLLNSIKIDERGVPVGIEFLNMSNLQVYNMKGWDGVSELDLFLRCPKLKHMNWQTLFTKEDSTRRQVSKYVQKRQWPHLESLRIDNELQDVDLAAIIERAGSLSRIHIWRPNLGKESFRQLGQFFGTLTSVDLKKCASATSPMIRDLLCYCQILDNLYARDLHARDIAQGGPWCCRELRVLWIRIVFDTSEQDLHPVVFERMSSLVRLECLHLMRPMNESGNHHGLKLRLDHGMGQLASLRQLRRVFILRGVPVRNYSFPQIGKEDAEWILDNWKHLVLMSGYLNEDKELDKAVKKELSGQGMYVDRPMMRSLRS